MPYSAKVVTITVNVRLGKNFIFQNFTFKILLRTYLIKNLFHLPADSASRDESTALIVAYMQKKRTPRSVWHVLCGAANKLLTDCCQHCWQCARRPQTTRHFTGWHHAPWWGGNTKCEDDSQWRAIAVLTHLVTARVIKSHFDNVTSLKVADTSLVLKTVKQMKLSYEKRLFYRACLQLQLNPVVVS